MPSISRPGLLGSLRDALGAPGPAVVVVRGASGSGKSTLLRDVLGGSPPGGEAPPLAVVGTAGPARRHLRSLAEALQRRGVPLPEGPPTWPTLLEALRLDLDTHRRPAVVVLDDVHHMLDATPTLSDALGRLWSGARARGLPLHLVLASSQGGALDAVMDAWGPPAGAAVHTVDVGAVALADLRAHLADWSPRDRFVVLGCLGRSPATLGKVDPGLRPTTNVQRLVLDPDGPLHGLPSRQLEARTQKPERYAGIVAALAEGAREWGEITEANPAFTSGNQLGPYLATLQDAGWVEAHRSLDAPPRSRRRRYRLADPFVGFWYGVVEPALGPLLGGATPARLWRVHLADALDRHLAAVFPDACRQALAEGGDAFVGARAREVGGLWGDDLDLPVAGTLRNGAVVYGRCVWGRTATVADADAAYRHMRATRYGFGREARLRVLFTGAGATEPLLRRAARDDLLTLVGPADLF